MSPAKSLPTPTSPLATHAISAAPPSVARYFATSLLRSSVLPKDRDPLFSMPYTLFSIYNFSHPLYFLSPAHSLPKTPGGGVSTFLRNSPGLVTPLESALPQEQTCHFVTPIESTHFSQLPSFCAKLAPVTPASTTLTEHTPNNPIRMNTSAKRHRASCPNYQLKQFVLTHLREFQRGLGIPLRTQLAIASLPPYFLTSLSSCSRHSYSRSSRASLLHRRRKLPICAILLPELLCPTPPNCSPNSRTVSPRPQRRPPRSIVHPAASISLANTPTTTTASFSPPPSASLARWLSLRAATANWSSIPKPTAPRWKPISTLCLHTPSTIGRTIPLASPAFSKNRASKNRVSRKPATASPAPISTSPATFPSAWASVPPPPSTSAWPTR